MRSITLLLALVLLTASQGVAQQPTSRADVPDSAALAQMAGMFNQMGPMYETMMQSMVEGTIKAFEKQETIDRLARFSRRYYEALVRQGFSKEEALQIVAGVGIASMRTGR